MRGLTMVAVAVVAAASGWAINRASSGLEGAQLWVAVGALLAGGATWLAKRTLQGLQARAEAHPKAVAPAIAIDADRHRYARWLYFAGLATMPMLVLRVGGITLSDMAFFAALGLAFADTALDRDYRAPSIPTLLVVGLLFFTTGSLIATVEHSTNEASSFGVLARVLYLFVAWFLLGAAVLRTSDQVRTAIKWWAIGAAICGFYAVAQRAGFVPGEVDPDGRVAGLADHVNDLGSLSAVAAVPALMIVYTARGWAERSAFAVCVVGILVGLTLSGSIGAAGALIIALLVCMVSAQLARAVLIAALVGTCALVYASATTGLEGTPIGRFAVATDAGASNGQGTLHTRIDTLTVAWQQIRADPFVGVGLDPQSSEIFSYITGQTHAVHNLFIGRWYESGLLGLIGICIIVWALLRSGWHNVVATRSREQLMAISLLASTWGFVAVGMSEPLLYKRYALAGPALVLAFEAMRRRREAVASAAAPTGGAGVARVAAPLASRAEARGARAGA